MNSKGNMTAVEWMSENLKGHITEGILEEVTIQAKQMEKEQIVIAITDNLPIEDGVITAVQKAEQYYNETFKLE